MKNLKLVLTFICLTISNCLNAQYFNQNNTTLIFGTNIGTNALLEGGYFGFSEIDNNRLAFNSILSYGYFSGAYYRNAYWNSNSGNGNFGSANNFYSNLSGNNANLMRGISLVDLDLNGKLDPVIVKNNELQVHRNLNGTITSAIQNISSGAGDYIEKGRYNFEDGYEDVAVKSGSNVRIYRNLTNGYLNTSFYGPFNISSGKFKFAQMTDKDLPYSPNNSGDRDDFVTISGNNIKVYKNNDNNGVNSTPYADINTGSVISDLDVGDLTGDGLNDIVIVKGFPDNKAEIYINVQGVLIGSNPIWSMTRSNYNYISPLVKIADVNRDGRNDIVIAADGIIVDLFLNTVTGMQNVPAQTLLLFSGSEHVVDIDINDVYNQGGQSLTIGYSQGFTNMYYYVVNINASNYNPNPVPPHIIKETVVQGSFVRPRIRLRNNNERDQTQYQIWKRKNSPNFSHIATITGGNNAEFIDYSEYLIIDDGLPGEDNCWYKVKAVDATSKISDFSNQIGYTVGQPACIGCSEDNLETIKTNPVPTEYSITNFPNPFNPVTKITYAIPLDGLVKITVFNSLGQEVKTLLNEFKNKGVHFVDFSGNNLSSGIYYYKIEVNDFVKINKMVLVK